MFCGLFFGISFLNHRKTSAIAGFDDEAGVGVE
jgi:hypothetical protein